MKTTTWMVLLATGLLAGCGSDDGEPIEPTGSGGSADGGGGSSTSVGGGGSGGASEGGAGGTGSGVMVAPDWSCIGTSSPTPYEPGEATGDINLNNIVSGMPMADVTMTVCGLDDPECLEPMGSATSNENGHVQMSVTTAEQIYFEMAGPDLPTTLGIREQRPIDGFLMNWTLIDEGSLELFVSLATGGGSIIAGRGQLGLRVIDCANTYSEGVTFELDLADGQSSLAYFNVSGYPNPALTETTTYGGAGFANLPPGEGTLTAKVAETGEVITTRTVLIRQDAVTLLNTITPDPEGE